MMYRAILKEIDYDMKRVAVKVGKRANLLHYEKNTQIYGIHET